MVFVFSLCISVASARPGRDIVVVQMNKRMHDPYLVKDMDSEVRI